MSVRIPAPPKKELEHWYYEDNLTNQQVADLYGHSTTLIKRWKRKYGIKNSALENRIPRKLRSFPIPDDMSWAIGFLAADGCMKEGSHKDYMLAINLRDYDIDALKKIKSVFGLGKIYGPNKNNFDNDIYEWCIGVARSVEILFELGIVPRKTRIAQLPNPNLISMPDYLRGLFDGDGCWHVKTKKRKYGESILLHFNFTTASRDLAESVNKILNKITGSSAGIIERSNSVNDGALFTTDATSYILTYDSRNARKIARYVYQNKVPSLNRKFNIVNEFINL